MCGIAGIMATGREGPAAATIAALGAALAHRGPDGHGEYRAGNVAMVHNRLAIIDLVTGDQPLVEPGGAALIANGEIYNYLELRGAIDGVNLATSSDCEPPLHLYRRRGLDFAAALRGMYAIAIHDGRAGHLVLTRDPFGIKPLYYVAGEDGVAFASEAQALVAAGLARAEVAEEPRDELLQLQFTTRRDTILKGVERVLPGETLVVAHGRIIERRRVPALPAGGPQDWTEEGALERLDAVLRDTVLVHQRSDVPYGMFLSGGIDSSVLLAMMARLNPRPVRAYTAGFAGGNVPDEREAARAVAKAVGAEHVEVEFAERDFWTLLPAIAAAMDDPAADYACLPTYKLGAVAAKELKVVLCGEGGDELFAGYGRYRSVTRPWWMGGRTLRRRGVFDGLEVLSGDPRGWRDGIAAAEAMASTDGRTRLQVAQAVDCADWLPNDLLAKLDRCLMAHGVEGRTPFLDPVMAEFAFRLPDTLKVRGHYGKWLLRRWLELNLPAARPFERKRGFTVPVAAWIAPQGAKLGPLVAAQPGIAEIAEPHAVERLFREASGKHPGFAAWVLLFYALWHRRHVLGLAPQGDVLETLAATRGGG